MQTQTPKCISIVICNEVLEDKRTNNKSLIGLFNMVATTALPCVQPRLCILVSLVEGQGEVPVKIRIVSPSNETLVQVEGKQHFDSPRDVADLVFEFQSLPLHEAGEYAVDVFANDEHRAERRFTLLLQPAAASSSQAQA